MHWHASSSQNFVKDMQCFAVVNFTAFESNHTADTGLTTQSGQSKRDTLIYYVLK